MFFTWILSTLFLTDIVLLFIYVIKKNKAALWACIIIFAIMIGIVLSVTATSMHTSLPTVRTPAVTAATTLTYNGTTLTYKNNEYGFSLVFPDTWKGLTVSNLTRDTVADSPAVAVFKYSLDQVVFTITVYTKEQFTALTTAHPNGVPYTYNGKFAENDSFVFTAYGDQDAEITTLPRTKDVVGILKTFKLISEN